MFGHLKTIKVWVARFHREYHFVFGDGGKKLPELEDVAVFSRVREIPRDVMAHVDTPEVSG